MDGSTINDDTGSVSAETTSTGTVKKTSENSNINGWFMSLYLMIWVVIYLLMNRIIKKQRCFKYIFDLIFIGIGICFLLLIFYSPWNQSLNNKIKKSKERYDKIKPDTEPIFQQQIKAFWLNDLNEQTQYYLYAYMLLSFLPFFYGLIAFLAIQMDIENLHLFIVQFSLFYTGLQLFIYNITVNKWWSIIIPVILFLFMIAIVWNNLTFGLYQTIAIVTLLVITSIVQLKMSSTLGILLSLFLCVGISFLGLMKKLGLSTYQEG